MTTLRTAAQQALEALERGAIRFDAPIFYTQAIAALRAELEQPEHPRRLTDDEIGQIWFAAKIPGLTESDARRLIRAAEEAR